MKPAATAPARPVKPAAASSRSTASRVLLHPAGKPLLFVVCLLPFASLFYGAWANTLGANPAETLIRSTGDWTLRFLCLTLVITPLRTLAGWPALLRFRRMLGLFSFFYVCLHFLAYAWLDKSLEVNEILRDIAKRPFILVGTTALVLMLPLAATSFNRAIKALGAKRWQQLHRLVYVIVLLGLVHFFWMRAAKNNFGDPLLYAAIVAVLLGWRVVHAVRKRRAA